MFEVGAADATPEQIMQKIWAELAGAGLIAGCAPELGVAPEWIE